MQTLTQQRSLPFRLLFLSILGLVACSSSSHVSLTDITPTDTFILDFANPGTNVTVSRTAPYFGENSSCPHNGAHIHFLQNGSEEFGLVNIIAPFDATVDEINTCKNVGESDGFQINLRYADPLYDQATFEMSNEPQDGFHCVTSEGGVANFYEPYILVAEGDIVTAGQIIAQLPIASNIDDAAHIHFNLRGDETACPNIFTTDVTTEFAALYGGMPCETPTTETFCFAPSASEDLTGLGAETL